MLFIFKKNRYQFDSICLPFFLALLILFNILFLLIANPIHAQTKFYRIHFGSYKNIKYADKAVSRLKKLGYNAVFRHEEVHGKGKWYRAYVEQFKSKEAAEKAAKGLTELELISGYNISVAFESDPPETYSRDQNISEIRKEPALSGEKNQNNAVNMTSEKEGSVHIKDIKFEKSENGKETLYIYSNTFFVPEIFPLEEDNPKIVVDIQNTESIKKGLETIDVEGRIIRRIRSYLHRGSKKLRIVLDLEPDKNYYTDQLFYQKENIYSLEVKEDNMGE